MRRHLLQVLAVVLVAFLFLDGAAAGVVVGRNGFPLHNAETLDAPAELPSWPNWSVAGEGDDQYFGSALASAGDVNGDGYADVIVGARCYDSGSCRGKAYVYYGSALGLDLTPGWTATGENDVDYFGRAVSGAGDVNGDGYDDVVVGASGAGDRGKIYVYAGSSTGLSSAPSWTAEGEAVGDAFGYSAAGAGDVNGDGYADVIAGAIWGGGGTGRVYLFLGGPGGLGPSSWNATGQNAIDEFGLAVAGAGDVNGDGYADVAVGAPAYAAAGWVGAAYVYHGSASGLGATPAWTEVGESGGDAFGGALATAGDVNGDGYADLLVGARSYDSADSRGKAYLYPGSSSGLNALPLWTTTGASQGDGFAASVGSAGDVNGDGYADMVIGAPGRSTSHGIAYVYHGSPTGPSTAWLDSGEQDLDCFGAAVAGAGDVNGDGFADILVGANAYPNGAWRGRAYAYYGGADAPSFFDVWNQSGQNPGDEYGYSLAPAGDVNRDGYSDVIVGAPWYPGSDQRGKAYLYYGSPTGLSDFPGWLATGENAHDNFGFGVAPAGDVNGDGYADVVVSAPGYPISAGQGKLYIYHGGSTGLSPTPNWVATGESGNDYFGDAVAGAGDLNGDGYADLVAGARGYAGGGKVYAYFGSATGLGADADWTVVAENTSDLLGSPVAGAGDVNGDGYADLVVGAEGYPQGNYRGKVYAYLGGPTGPGPTADWTSTGQNYADFLGGSASTAGDVNGDGYADLVVGARGYPGPVARGRVYVYFGSATGLGLFAATIDGENDGDHFGAAVASAGNMDGDWFADVIIGADYWTSSQGKAYVYPGTASGPGASPARVFVGENQHDRYGLAVSSAGDVNGDGYPEVLVAAPGYLSGSNHGKAYMYLGNQAQGRRVLAQQLRGDGSGVLVQPWGLSHQGNRFVVSMWATDPAGRGRARLEVEACPAGEQFGTLACTQYLSPTWLDVTASETGVQFVEAISGLEVETLYRWRARVLHAPFTVTEPGITSPPNPAHGPWRRFQGQALEADLRTVRGWEVYLPLVATPR